MTPSKLVPCAAPGVCRNVAYQDDNGDYDLRGVKDTVEVPDDFAGVAYCSVECMLYSGGGPDQQECEV